MYKLILICLFSCLLFSCASTDEINPADVKIAQLRSTTREMNDKIAALNQTQEDLISQIEQLKQENSHLQAELLDTQSTIKKAFAALKKKQKYEIEKTIKENLAKNINDQERLNAKLSKIIKTIQSQNENLQEKLLNDLAVNNQEVKSMRVQLNACLDKILRLEKQLKIINSSVPSYSSASKTSASTTAPKSSTWRKKTKIKRTNKPTAPDIDYSTGYEHTVVEGESLWKISRDYGVSVQDIINTNPQIDDKTILTPGQKIFVPYRKK